MADSGSTRRTVDSDPQSYKLSDLLKCGWKIFEEVDTTNEPIGSNNVQLKVKRGITALEDVTQMVAQLDLFSHNELLDEIATTDLKYILLPALLGGLTMKLTNRDNRLEIVSKAREYFNEFLRRCKEYNVSDFKLPESLTEPDKESKSTQSPAKVNNELKSSMSTAKCKVGAFYEVGKD